jgi:hypothetical protein
MLKHQIVALASASLSVTVTIRGCLTIFKPY